MITFLASCVLIIFQINWNRSQLQLIFEKKAERLSLVFTSRLDDIERELLLLKSFYKASEQVNRDEFKVFTEQIRVSLPELQGVSWVPVVQGKDLSLFESKVQQEGFENFLVIEQRGSQLAPVPRDEAFYTPVTYVEPYEANKQALGYNVVSNPIRREAMLRARDSNQVAATATIQLIIDKEKIPAFLLIAPFYEEEVFKEGFIDTSKHKGYLIVVLRLIDLIDQAWKDWNEGQVGITIKDVTESTKENIVYSSEDNLSDPSFSKAVFIGGRKWKIEFFETAEFRRTHATYSAITVAVISLLFSFLLGGFLWGRLKQLALTEKLSKHLEVVLEEVLQGVKEGVIILGPSADIQMLNPSAYEIFSIQSENILKKPITHLIPQLNLREWLDEKKFIREFENIRISEKVLTLEVGLSTLPSLGGKSYLLIIRDVTARKETERQMQAFTRELQRSNEDLDEFAYIASHDLKEPLRGIRSYAKFVSEDHEKQLNEEGKRKLQVIIELTERMENLIQSLLQLSLLERSKVRVERIDLKKLVERVRTFLKITLEQQQVELKVSPDLPKIDCDHVRVEEVFQNLISNAIKYNKNEHKSVEVGYEPYQQSKHGSALLEGQKSPQEGTPVYFVRDNGIGIEKRHRESIFRLCQRLHGHKQFGGGCGVGLSLTKKVVEQHGGVVWLESAKGKGTTFFFTLPHAPEQRLSRLK